MEPQILLYYNYTHIEDPEVLLKEQRALCNSLDLKGRIIIAPEGINGTVEGSTEATERYIAEFLKDPRFANTNFKKSIGTWEAFPKLSIKVREEIVSAHLGEADVNPAETTGVHLSVEELHNWIHSDKEFYIVDMRNDYEHTVGHFRNSILPKMHHFRELPDILPEIDHLRDKVIVTVCTGGVRCEKASGFLLKNGFNQVYQLKDGIVSYMERYPNEDFLGTLYVFDGRVVMGFHSEDHQHQIVGICERCGNPSERFVNCDNLMCHRHFICCEACTTPGKTYCGRQCMANLVRA